jgi:hypothetical protein
MAFARASLSGVLALSLVACGGGGDSAPATSNNGGTATGSGTGTGTTTASAGCSLPERQAFVLDVLEDVYLFPDLLDTSVNPANFTTVQGYIDALVAPARAQSRDVGFTFITSIAEENELIATGSNAGFGFRIAFDDQNRAFILEAFENAPAFPAGIDRGSELLAVEGQTVASLVGEGGTGAVIDAFGPTEAGVTRELTFTDSAGASVTANITKAEFSLDPISDRYGVEILNDGTEDVGYINLRTFIVRDAGPQLIAAFGQLQAAGIDKVILDFRYNGGGLVSVAELMGDLMGGGRTGQVFSNTVFSPARSQFNSTRNFISEANALGITKLAVIGTSGTASASELVTNSFIPYLGADLALIGSNTSGKPVGQEAFDRSACDDRLRAVSFQTTNADNEGEYFTGLAGVVDMTCTAEDDFTNPLGDPAEASISVALDFLAGRSCTPIATGQERTVQSAGNRLELLQPSQPTAAQREVPGLF